MQLTKLFEGVSAANTAINTGSGASGLTLAYPEHIYPAGSPNNTKDVISPPRGFDALLVFVQPSGTAVASTLDLDNGAAKVRIATPANAGPWCAGIGHDVGEAAQGVAGAGQYLGSLRGVGIGRNPVITLGALGAAITGSLTVYGVTL